MTVVIACALWSAAAAASTCGGADTDALGARNELVGWALAGVTGIGVFVATLLCRRRGLGLGPVSAGWVMLGVHPAFWLGVDGGDCGRTRLEGSVLFACMAIALVMWAAWRPVDATTGISDTESAGS